MTKKKVIKNYNEFRENGWNSASEVARRMTKLDYTILGWIFFFVVTILFIVSVVLINIRIDKRILEKKAFSVEKIEEKYNSNVVSPSYYLVDNENYLKPQDRKELGSFIDSNNSLLKVFFMSTNEKNLDDIAKRIRDAFNNGTGREGYDNSFDEFYSVVLVYNIADNSYYVCPLDEFALDSKMFREINKTDISSSGNAVVDSTRVVSFCKDAIKYSTDICKDVLGGDVVSNYKNLYEKISKEAFPGEAYNDMIEQLIEIENNSVKGNTIACSICISSIVVFLFAIFIFYVCFDCAESFYFHIINKRKAIIDEYINNMKEIEKKKKSDEEAKKKAKEAEEKALIWNNPISRIIEKLETINPLNEEILQKRDILIGKMKVVNDIITFNDNDSMEKFFRQYKSAYFPILEDVVDSLIKNAVTYHTGFNTDEETGILIKMMDNYIGMMDNVIEHSNDFPMLDIEANLNAVINLAKMNGTIK